MCKNCEDSKKAVPDDAVAIPIDPAKLPLPVMLNLFQQTTQVTAQLIANNIHDEMETPEQQEALQHDLMEAAEISLKMFEDLMVEKKWTSGKTVYASLYTVFTVINKLREEMDKFVASQTAAEKEETKSVPPGLPGKGKEHWN